MNTSLNNTSGLLYLAAMAVKGKKLDLLKELFFFTLRFLNNSRLHKCY